MTDISSNPLQDWMDERNELRIQRQEADHRCELLRAEVERLTAWHKESGDLIGRQVNEITDLHNEIERLRSWSKSAQEAFERGHRLEDEVERYQTLLRETLEIWHDEEGKLRVENERLRAENKGARRYLAAAVIQAGGELVIENWALVRVTDKTTLSRDQVLDIPGERFKAY